MSSNVADTEARTLRSPGLYDSAAPLSRATAIIMASGRGAEALLPLIVIALNTEIVSYGKQGFRDVRSICLRGGG